MKALLLPLGMRCNAASAVNAIVNQPRLTFDWTQMNVDSMIQILNLSKESIPSFWEGYFSDLDSTNHHKRTQSWFPHDSFTSDEERKGSLEKYIRRTLRLYDAIRRTDFKIFVIFFGFPNHTSLEIVQKLVGCLDTKFGSSYHVIVCNAIHQEFEKENITFLFEELKSLGTGSGDDDWADLTKRVEGRIRKLIQEKGYDVIPIE